MIARAVARLVAVAISLVAGLVVLEVAFRVLDDQSLTRLTLTLRPEAVTVNSRDLRPDLRYVERVARAPGVQRGWYDEEPTPRARIPLDEELAARAARYPDPVTPFFEFNRSYLLQQLCSGRRDGLEGLDDFFFYEPTTDTPYPSYRHLRHVSPPGWFVTNNFGWRGPDVTLHRPADIVRIAFVGASTTVDAYSVPFSHPELVEHWLNRRATALGSPYRVQVINAGRTGIDSKSIAAVAVREVGPIDPDIIVFYEGANQFWPGQVLEYQLGRFFPKPLATFRQRTTLENYSAVVRRILSMWDRVRGRDGSEPAKPPSHVSWPAGVNEQQPDPRDERLPMDLPQVVRDLDAIREAVRASGGELVLSTFVWLAHDGLQLDLRAHANIYRYLNDTLWPIPYAHVRRMADFQNRVFAEYADQTESALVDIAAEFPDDPDLFDDPIHMNYSGLRLQGWIYAQHLARILDARAAAGLLPRPAPGPLDAHPAFASAERRLVGVGDLLRHCS
jgi:hypothetical protein